MPLDFHLATFLEDFKRFCLGRGELDGYRDSVLLTTAFFGDGGDAAALENRSGRRRARFLDHDVHQGADPNPLGDLALALVFVLVFILVLIATSHRASPLARLNP
jgi:hypothetical protein